MWTSDLVQTSRQATDLELSIVGKTWDHGQIITDVFGGVPGSHWKVDFLDRFLSK